MARATKKPLQWWVVPGIVTGSIAALSGLGKLAIDYAKQASLPDRVEAAERKNAEQDQVLNKLTGIQETWQQIYQQQKQQASNQMMPVQPVGPPIVPPPVATPPPVPTYWTATDPQGHLYCYNATQSWWPNTQGACE